MGTWYGARGRLTVQPEPDEALMREFAQFNLMSCPKDYHLEKFANSWFFDAEKRLASIAGKFMEPKIWYEHMKKYFFEPRGYELVGDPEFIWEMDPGFWEWAEEIQEEFYALGYWALPLPGHAPYREDMSPFLN